MVLDEKNGLQNKSVLNGKKSQRQLTDVDSKETISLKDALLQFFLKIKIKIKTTLAANSVFYMKNDFRTFSHVAHKEMEFCK